MHSDASSSGVMSVRVAPETQRELDTLAARMDRSRAWVVNQAIDAYLDLYRWQEDQIRQAVQEADAGGKFFSGEEIDALIARYKP